METTTVNFLTLDEAVSEGNLWVTLNTSSDVGRCLVQLQPYGLARATVANSTFGLGLDFEALTAIADNFLAASAPSYTFIPYPEGSKNSGYHLYKGKDGVLVHTVYGWEAGRVTLAIPASMVRDAGGIINTHLPLRGEGESLTPVGGQVSLRPGVRLPVASDRVNLYAGYTESDELADPNEMRFILDDSCPYTYGW